MARYYRTVGVIAVALCGMVACETEEDVVGTTDASVGGTLNSGGSSGDAAPADAGGAGSDAADAMIVSDAVADVGPDAGKDSSSADDSSPEDAAPQISDADLRGMECADFCDAVYADCTGDNKQYNSLPECYGLCTKLPGAVFSCRQLHLGRANGDSGKTIHCPHAGGVGDCVDD